jgi:hypothetical protein
MTTLKDVEPHDVTFNTLSLQCAKVLKWLQYIQNIKKVLTKTNIAELTDVILKKWVNQQQTNINCMMCVQS